MNMNNTSYLSSRLAVKNENMTINVSGTGGMNMITFIVQS